MTDAEILALEEQYPVMDAPKQAVIAGQRIGLVRYLQRVRRLMLDPATLVTHPMLVHRWERGQERRMSLPRRFCPQFWGSDTLQAHSRSLSVGQENPRS